MADILKRFKWMKKFDNCQTVEDVVYKQMRLTIDSTAEAYSDITMAAFGYIQVKLWDLESPFAALTRKQMDHITALEFKVEQIERVNNDYKAMIEKLKDENRELRLRLDIAEVRETGTAGVGTRYET